MQWLRFKRNYVKKKKKKKQQQQEENTVLYEKWGKLKHTPHTHTDLNEPCLHVNTYMQSKTSWPKKKKNRRRSS